MGSDMKHATKKDMEDIFYLLHYRQYEPYGYPVEGASEGSYFFPIDKVDIKRHKGLKVFCANDYQNFYGVLDSVVDRFASVAGSDGSKIKVFKDTCALVH